MYVCLYMFGFCSNNKCLIVLYQDDMMIIIKLLLMILIIFRTVDMNTMIRIDDPELDKAEEEFEKLLVDGDD